MGDCGIGGSPLLAAFPAVAHRKTCWCGPENIGPWIGWLTSSSVRARSPVARRSRRAISALPERQALDDALELVVPLRVRPEGGRHVGAVERHAHGAERGACRHGHLDARVVARDVLGRARDDADAERLRRRDRQPAARTAVGASTSAAHCGRGDACQSLHRSSPSTLVYTTTMSQIGTRASRFAGLYSGPLISGLFRLSLPDAGRDEGRRPRLHREGVRRRAVAGTG